MSIDPRILKTEECVDQNAGLERIQSLWPEMNALLSAFCQGNWNAVTSEAVPAFQKAQTPAEQAFVLQWAVAATELTGDYALRARWISRWSEIGLWATEPYSAYLRTFHEGLGMYFESRFREAEAHFKRAYALAQEFDYARGRMRCLFHLGLVAKHRGDLNRAIEYFGHALVLAESRKAKSYIERIEGQLLSTGVPRPDAKIPELARLIQRLEAAIVQKDLTEAKKLVIDAELLRRRLRLSRRKESIYIYTPLILWLSGRDRFANRLFHRIRDQALQVKVLELKRAALGLSITEERQLTLLKEILGICQVIVRSPIDGGSIEVCGRKLANIREADIRALLMLLLNSREPVSKEELCRSIWNLRYDPTIHDGKLYKLIHRARKLFGRDDLILSTVGAYRINPEWVPDTQALKVS